MKPTLKPITFKKACDIINASIACIVDEDALSYPVLNQDFDGNDCIEVNWNTDEGLMENSFGITNTYFIDDKGRLLINDNGEDYTLQMLKITKVK